MKTQHVALQLQTKQNNKIQNSVTVLTTSLPHSISFCFMLNFGLCFVTDVHSTRFIRFIGCVMTNFFLQKLGVNLIYTGF